MSVRGVLGLALLAGSGAMDAVDRFKPFKLKTPDGSPKTLEDLPQSDNATDALQGFALDPFRISPMLHWLTSGQVNGLASATGANGNIPSPRHPGRTTPG